MATLTVKLSPEQHSAIIAAVTMRLETCKAGCDADTVMAQAAYAIEAENLRDALAELGLARDYLAESATAS